MEAIKLCRKCGHSRPVSEFYADRHQSDGLQVRCKWCKRQEMRNLRAARQRFPVQPAAERACTACRIVQPAACFYADPTDSTGLHNECKECGKARAAKRRDAWRSRPHAARPAIKECRMCMQVKPGREFTANTMTADGLNANCRICSRIQWTAGKYGVSLMEAMRLRSARYCDICHCVLEDRTRNVDHCHATGAVRGVLCNKCNALLGFAGDKTAVLQEAIDYLKRSRASQLDDHPKISVTSEPLAVH